MSSGQKGLRVKDIARRLYNMNCSFFDDLDFEALRKYVQTFLAGNARKNNSMVEQKEWGVYTIRKDYFDSMFDFQDAELEESSLVSEPTDDDRYIQLELFSDEEES